MAGAGAQVGVAGRMMLLFGFVVYLFIVVQVKLLFHSHVILSSRPADKKKRTCLSKRQQIEFEEGLCGCVPSGSHPFLL